MVKRIIGLMWLKLKSLLEKVDKTLFSARQKLLLLKLTICPHLTWLSWLESTLQPTATTYILEEVEWSGQVR